MDGGSKKPQVRFTQSHRELLSVQGERKTALEVLGLQQLPTKLGFESLPLDAPLTPDCLSDVRVLVLGAPREELDGEIEVIQHFVEDGGGLLLITDSDAIVGSVDSLNELAQMIDLEFREYLHYPPHWLEAFSPHYITANVDRVQVKSVAQVVRVNGARELAFAEHPCSSVCACGLFGRGRVVAVGDVGLFTTEMLKQKGNQTLVTNLFRWLAAQNMVEIQELIIPETVKWGQSASVVLTLYNGHDEARLQAKCVPESDVDASISEEPSKKRSIPPGKATEMRWMVKPQILGAQKLRLSISIAGQPSLYFDRLWPDMRCEAPGYLTLHIHKEESPVTELRTGEFFEVDGSFHWPAGLNPPPYQLELELGEGLVERGYQAGEGASRWHLQAVAPGAHTLTLRLKETDQLLPAVVTVKSSIPEQITELQAAYIAPLDSEIAERLRWIDP